MKHISADILGELGPFPGVTSVHGVTYDGERLWVAAGERLEAVDPRTGASLSSHVVAANAGTAFDGRHLFQIAGDRINRIDPETGAVLASIPAPEGGGSGLAWAEGSLWVGQHRARKIHRIDPETGAILRTLTSDRFVTGITWAEGELWHGTWENEQSEIRRIDPETGEVREALDMPAGKIVAGLEWDGGERFFCGGGSSGRVRVVRRPRRAA